MQLKSLSRLILLAVLAASLASLIGQSPASAGGWQLLALSGGFWNGGQLYAVDSSGRMNFRGQVASKHPGVHAMAYSQGYVWVVADDAFLDGGSDLYKIPVAQLRSGAESKGDLGTWVRQLAPATSNGTFVATEMFADPSRKNKFYIYSDGNGSDYPNETLFNFRTKKGTFKPGASSSMDTGVAVDIAPNGKVWAADSNQLWRLSKRGDLRRRWNLRFPPESGDFSRLSAMAFNPGTGELVGFVNSAWATGGGKSFFAIVDMRSATRGAMTRFGRIQGVKVESMTWIPS